MNKTLFNFNRSFRKWVFSNGNFNLIQDCGGRENAQKVANIINGAKTRIERQGKAFECLDGMARSQISRLTVNGA